MKGSLLVTFLGATSVAASPSPTVDPPTCTTVLGGASVGADLLKATGIPFGPKATGCADLEVLIGLYQELFKLGNSLTDAKLEELAKVALMVLLSEIH